jgi:hypothetical protein
MNRWAGFLAAALFLAGPVWAGEAVRTPPGWDPNRDPAFTADYIRRQLTLDLERVDPRRGITGTIRNDGSKTLTRVRVLLTFMDAAGRPAGEFEFSALPWSGPVGPGEPAERPLTAGSTRKFLVYPSSVAAGWSDRWQAAIASITFAPEPS